MLNSDKNSLTGCMGYVGNKHIEAEMIKCFELALYQSHKRRMKKQFTENAVSPSGCIS